MRAEKRRRRPRQSVGRRTSWSGKQAAGELAPPAPLAAGTRPGAPGTCRGLRWLCCGASRNWLPTRAASPNPARVPICPKHGGQPGSPDSHDPPPASVTSHVLPPPGAPPAAVLLPGEPCVASPLSLAAVRDPRRASPRPFLCSPRPAPHLTGTLLVQGSPKCCSGPDFPVISIFEDNSWCARHYGKQFS